MAFSGSVSGTTLSANRAIDHAFRRCRIPAQAISAEMQAYALESLQYMLDSIANTRTPSWCIERVVLPMYQNQPVVQLPVGTVEILNLNYRVLAPVSGTVAQTATAYTVNFGTAVAVNTVGVKWSAAGVEAQLQTSDDNVTWATVGTLAAGAAAGEIQWVDVNAALPATYFRITSTLPLVLETVTLGNLPQEIPLGALNRDGYVNQSNKAFPGRPTSYYFQRDLPEPIVRLWPAPFAAAEQAQLILWRHRYIMDTENLRREVEVPRRWREALINGLAARLAAETPMVDAGLIPVLEQRAAMSMQDAWQGDGDGSPTYINPGIGVYSK